MRKLGALACVAFAALAATPAKAGFMVVRYESGMCQILGDAAGPPPRPPLRYVILVDRFGSWLEALAAMNGLHTQGQCRWVSPFLG
jgi:hypothetical protein